MRTTRMQRKNKLFDFLENSEIVKQLFKPSCLQQVGKQYEFSCKLSMLISSKGN